MSTPATVSLDLKRYEMINLQTRDLVTGWIRTNSSNSIPFCVNQICCIFFAEFDDWDQNFMSDQFTIDPVNNKILHHSEGQHGLYSAFLTNIASSGKHCWKFKIINWGDSNLMFGVWNLKSDTPKSQALSTYIGKTANTSYVFDYGFAELNKYDKNGIWTGAGTYGETVKVGSIIQMTLDLKDLTISYIINDEDYGVAFKEIEKSKYSAVITSYHGDNCVELLKYEQFYK